MELTFDIDIESLLKRLSKGNYPPYDFIYVRKDAKEFYLLEMAVAGFKEEDLNIEMTGDYLSVSAQCKVHYQDAQFIYKGIARRDFKHVFKVNDELILQENIQLKDGILRILFIRKIKENSKRKVFKINLQAQLLL